MLACVRYFILTHKAILLINVYKATEIEGTQETSGLKFFFINSGLTSTFISVVFREFCFENCLSTVGMYHYQ